jgi:hypothetical protein
MAPQEQLLPGARPIRGKLMDTARVHPETLAGDPFAAAGGHRDHHPDDHPHSCNDGWVTIGQIVVDEETGEEVEEYAMYLCRRCQEACFKRREKVAQR